MPVAKSAMCYLTLSLLSAGPLPASAADGKIEVLWLGHATVRIKTVGGKLLLIDPWLLKNPKTPAAYKNLDAVGKLDVILVTHGHNDHFADGPALAKKNNVPMYGPAGFNQSMQTLGVLPPALAPRMNKGGTVMPIGPNVKITMVRAEHSSEFVWPNPQTKKDEVHVGGEPGGFIIELENGFKIYHMGDTALFGDLKLIGELYRPDLVLIPIGGHFVMSPRDAAYATREYLKPKYAIPIHYGTHALLKGTPEEYTQALGSASTKVMVMKPGDKLEF